MIVTRSIALYIAPAFLAGAALVVVGHTLFDPGGGAPVKAAIPVPASIECDARFQRVRGYQRISPILTVDAACESPRLRDLKREIEALIAGERRLGQLFTASVYVSDLGSLDWMAVNGAEQYEPGSLMKVPLMLALLRMEEDAPGTLQRLVHLDAAPALPQVMFPPSTPLVPGRSYTIEELLAASISRSDNVATWLLNQQVSSSYFHKAFTELGLSDFADTDNSYPIGVRDYSRFLLGLYNGGYLGSRNSEKAMALLTASEFDRGIKAGLPAGTVAASKFGEAHGNGEMQLHESAVVYCQDRPYLITVMTSGPQMDRLPEIIRRISAAVYNEMSRQRASAQLSEIG